MNVDSIRNARAIFSPPPVRSRSGARRARSAVLGVCALGLLLAGTLGGYAASVQAQQDSGARQLQMRADPPPSPQSNPQFGYPGVPPGGTRRVIIVNPQPVAPVSPPAPPAAQMQREPGRHDPASRVMRAEPSPAPTQQPFGYPGPNSNRQVIIVGPAPTQSFSGASGAAMTGVNPSPSDLPGTAPGWR